jgi:hypothetical protein
LLVTEDELEARYAPGVYQQMMKDILGKDYEPKKATHAA